MKKSEKTLVGIAMMAAGAALIMVVGLPQWSAYSANRDEIASLNTDITTLNSSKDSLNAQIALLEKNTDIPPGIRIRTFNDQNREEIVKGLLDVVVNMATDAGNKFISLKPVAVDPMLAGGASSSTSTSTSTTTTDLKPAPGEAAPSTTTSTTSTSTSTTPAQPLLSTFGYELSIRGTYDTVQRFLRSMNDQKEMLEISGIKLENEALDQATSADKLSNPNFPIRLTSSIRLALQPEQH